MIDTSLRERARHWLLDAGLGGAAALALITMAHAGLPQAARIAKPQGPVQPALLTAAHAPSGPPVLIAFGDPVAGGVVVSPFGLRQLPWELSGRLHAGIDIMADKGQPVLAAADGVVAEAGTDGGYGRYVAVRHAEGLTSLYAHLGAIDAGVRPGLAVKAGDELGRIGTSGTSTGPHLHLEIRDARDRPLNPALFLGHAFAEASDLPLTKAQRFGRRVRIASVSMIPARKQAEMDARLEAAARDAASVGLDAVSKERIDGMKDVTIGPDGRPRAKLTL